LNGQFNFEAEEVEETLSEENWPEDSIVIDSPVSGSVWQTEVKLGQQVTAGETLMILESMKMEIPVQAAASGTISHILLTSGQRVKAGQALIVIEEQ